MNSGDFKWYWFYSILHPLKNKIFITYFHIYKNKINKRKKMRNIINKSSWKLFKTNTSKNEIGKKYMDVNYRKTSRNINNKSWLNIVKNIINWKNTPHYNYHKMFSIGKFGFILKVRYMGKFKKIVFPRKYGKYINFQAWVRKVSYAD